MNRDSFIFYRSFYEAIQDLKGKDRLALFDAICQKALYDQDSKLEGVTGTLYKLIKPQLDANTKKFIDGKKGGRPPKKTTGFENKKTTGFENKKPNVNDNVNVNDNDAVNNDSINDEIIFKFFEQNFGTISPFILDTIVSYQKDLPNELILYAFQLAVKANIKTMSYVEGILKSWISKNIKTLVEAKDEKKDFKKPQEEKQEDSWDEFIRVMKERGET